MYDLESCNRQGTLMVGLSLYYGLYFRGNQLLERCSNNFMGLDLVVWLDYLKDFNKAF
jgi:hypothetical protein